MDNNGNISRSAQEILEETNRVIAEMDSKMRSFNKKVNSSFTNFLDKKKELIESERDIIDLEEARLRKLAELGNVENDYTRALGHQIQSLRTINSRAAEQLTLSTAINGVVKDSGRFMMTQNKSLVGSFSDLLGFLNNADASFRDASLTLGLSGKNSDILRENLASSAEYAYKLGSSVQELGEMQEAYSEVLGRATLLSEEAFKNITQMAKGTKMGAGESAKMAAKFDLIGVSAAETSKFYTKLVNDSEQFGMNATVVLETFNKYFEKAQQYVFKGGVEGLKHMSMFAEKFKVSMDGVFGAMDKSFLLEGAVDMAAQLQVIGGQFAKSDPFQLLYQARNDAEGFAKNIQGMTRGLANFNKETGQIDIMAGDLQRLKLMSDATGMSFDDLIKQAKRGTQVDMMQNMLGNYDDPKVKSFIESIAQMQKDGSFQIEIAPGDMKDIRDLSQSQVQNLMSAQKSLEDRAKQAQTFDKVFGNIVNELKASLLPLLTGLSRFITFIGQNEWTRDLLKFGSILLLGVGGLYKALKVGKVLFGGLGRTAAQTVAQTATNTAGTAAANAAGTAATGAAGTTAQNMTQMGNAGKSAAPGMLAFGAAALMIGGAIYIAAKGISAMADSFAKLSPDQINGVNTAIALLGGTMVVLMGTMALLASTPVGWAAVGLMLAFGSASLLVASSVAIIANSIGNMAEKMKGTFQELGNIGEGAEGFTRIASAIQSIDDDKLSKLRETAEAISSLKSNSNGIAAMFGEMMNSPLKVEFAEKDVQMNINITNELDGAQLGQKMSKRIFTSIEASKNGKSSK